MPLSIVENKRVNVRDLEEVTFEKPPVEGFVFERDIGDDTIKLLRDQNFALYNKDELKNRLEFPWAFKIIFPDTDYGKNPPKGWLEMLRERVSVFKSNGNDEFLHTALNLKLMYPGLNFSNIRRELEEAVKDAEGGKNSHQAFRIISKAALISGKRYSEGEQEVLWQRGGGEENYYNSVRNAPYSSYDWALKEMVITRLVVSLRRPSEKFFTEQRQVLADLEKGKADPTQTPEKRLRSIAMRSACLKILQADEVSFGIYVWF